VACDLDWRLFAGGVGHCSPTRPQWTLLVNLARDPNANCHVVRDSGGGLAVEAGESVEHRFVLVVPRRSQLDVAHGLFPVIASVIPAWQCPVNWIR
jgi:hypothetical protein